jgi:hypothetical protein
MPVQPDSDATSCDHQTVTDPPDADPGHPVEHAVIATFRLTGGGYGLDTERAVIYEAQQKLREGVGQAGVGEFDGNEFGNGHVKLYAYGPDADKLFSVMSEHLQQVPFRPAHVVLRYGSAGDPSAAQRRVDL